MKMMSEALAAWPPHGKRGNWVPSKGNSPFNPLINPEAAPRPFDGCSCGFAVDSEPQQLAPVSVGGAGSASEPQHECEAGCMASSQKSVSPSAAIMRTP